MANENKLYWPGSVAKFSIANQIYKIAKASSAPIVAADLGAGMGGDWPKLVEDLPNLTMPVCLIWGAEDKVTPPHVAEAFHKLLPNSELNWISLCGHAPMWEHPKRFSEIVLHFLKNKF